MKNEVPCPSCDRKFSSALALSSHTRQKHATNGNGAAVAPASLALEYFEFPLSGGGVLRIEKRQGFQILRELVNEWFDAQQQNGAHS